LTSIPVAHAEPAQRQHAPRSTWLAIASLSLTMLLSSLGTSIANVALPTLATELAAPFQAVQWVVLAYLLASTTLMVTVGRLGDMLGRRRLLLAGIALFTLASVLCGLATSLWFLIAARALQGLGAATMMALTMALVSETVPKDKTGSAMGLLGTMSSVGTALGPSLGGALLAGPGWRAIFLVSVPLGALSLLLANRHLPADRPHQSRVGPRFDHLGTLLLALTLGCYSLAMTIGRGNFGAWNLGLLAGAFLAVMLFVLVEKRTHSPLIRLTVLRDRTLGAGLVMSALVSTVMMATLVVGPFYLSRALHLEPGHVGLVMSVGPLVAAVTGIPAGRMVDRLGPHRMTLFGLGAIAIGCVLLATQNGGITTYLLPLVITTSGYAIFQAANNTAVMAQVAPDQRGVISGLLNLSRNLGLITGAAFLGAVFAFASGAADLANAADTAVAAGMRATFVVAALLITIALVVGVLSRRMR